jgi:uncharacterized ferritin-like protein (DUF455 family)
MTPASVQSYAEQALYGTTLVDKLAAWPEVSVRGGTAHTRPLLPGRPKELALPTSHRKLPSVWKEDLQAKDGRARVLHELANHELQAIELIALALLRWPDAPAGFRRGLVATLRDEQRHCAMYLARLRACGEDVGVVPVSRFFWDTLGGIQTPEAFLAGLSLCFEVANLDFCQTWRTRFADAGDPKTADVLSAVYTDEIRHVAHGLVWFDRWTDGDRIDAWEQHLPPPLTPARGRGPQFDRVGRIAAGFTEAEVERLRTVGGSRGRPGRVLWFDAGIEEVVSGTPRSAISTRVSADLAVLPMFLCATHDTVVAPRPSPAFCGALADAGFVVPRFVDTLTRSDLGIHPLGSVEPWGPNPDVDVPGDVEVLGDVPVWNPAWQVLSSKTATARQVQTLALPGIVSDRGSVWTEEGDLGDGAWVIKAPFSASGTHRIRGRGPLSAAHRTWLRRQLDGHGEVLVQPWYDRVLDLSVHVTVDDDVRIDGISRFETAPNGAYTGAWLGRWTRGLPPELQREIHGGGDSAAVEPILLAAARQAGEWAQSLDYRGPLSIDATVVREDGHLAVHPWLETNARNTLGRIAMALSDRIDARSYGRWHVARRTPVATDALRKQISERPVQMRHGRIQQGVVATTPAETATTLLTWLDVSTTAPTG